MRQALLSGILAGAFVGAPAYAADIPARSITPAPIFNWTGFYAGVHAGYGWDESKHANAGASANFDIDGGVAGGHLGYNWHTGSIVVGLEADVAWTGIDGSIVGTCAPATCITEVDWLATVRGRAGFTWQKYLLYATAGVAFGEVTGTLDGGAAGVFSGSDTRTGWTAGVGIESMLAANWTARLEYLYVDLGNEVLYSFTVPGIGTFPTNIDTRFHLVRVALNYRY